MRRGIDIRTQQGRKVLGSAIACIGQCEHDGPNGFESGVCLSCSYPLSLWSYSNVISFFFSASSVGPVRFSEPETRVLWLAVLEMRRGVGFTGRGQRGGK